MSHRYKNYSVGDFDQFDCLKLSKLFYLILAFNLRGYVIWIISVTNMRDHVGIMQLIFPETALFYLSLISGTGGLFCLLIMSLRRPDAATWVQNSWRHMRKILIAALALDVAINLTAHHYFNLLSTQWLLMQLSGSAFLIVLLFVNKKVAINLSEFPEKLIESS